MGTLEFGFAVLGTGSVLTFVYEGVLGDIEPGGGESAAIEPKLRSSQGFFGGIGVSFSVHTFSPILGDESGVPGDMTGALLGRLLSHYDSYGAMMLGV